MKIVGVNIKRLREERGLTLRDMAKKLDVSASFLSQVETGKASPSLASLKSIADTFGTTIGALIGETVVPNGNPVVKESERKYLDHIGKGVRIYILTSPDPNKQMEPLLFKLEEGGSTGDSPYKHFGQEFVLVLKRRDGDIVERYQIRAEERRQHVLQFDDTAFFPQPYQRHDRSALGGHPADLLDIFLVFLFNAI